MSEQTWSKEWKSSKNPGKQRKYRSNAPYHRRSQFLSARLDEDVREKVGTKTLPIREGDRVKVLRGDYKGTYGDVREVDREEYKIYIEGVDRETVSGSEVTVAIDPSNVVITRLNLDDDMRVEKYDITEAEMEDISVEEETEEVAEDDDESSEPATDEESGDEDGGADSTEEEEAAADVDYEALVTENISDIKDRVRDEDLDAAKVLEAEKTNKDRKTLVEWLENRMED